MNGGKVAAAHGLGQVGIDNLAALGADAARQPVFILRPRHNTRAICGHRLKEYLGFRVLTALGTAGEKGVIGLPHPLIVCFILQIEVEGGGPQPQRNILLHPAVLSLEPQIELSRGIQVGEGHRQDEKRCVPALIESRFSQVQLQGFLHLGDAAVPGQARQGHGGGVIELFQRGRPACFFPTAGEEKGKKCGGNKTRKGADCLLLVHGDTSFRKMLTVCPAFLLFRRRCGCGSFPHRPAPDLDFPHSPAAYNRNRRPPRPPDSH